MRKAGEREPDAEFPAEEGPVGLGRDRLVAAAGEAEALERGRQVVAQRVEQEILSHAELGIEVAFGADVLATGLGRRDLDDQAGDRPLDPGLERPPIGPLVDPLATKTSGARTARGFPSSS